MPDQDEKVDNPEPLVLTKAQKAEIAKSELHARVNRNLTNHTPPEPKIADIELLRTSAKELGHLIVDICPEGREKSLAITDLESTLMWAVASIARNL